MAAPAPGHGHGLTGKVVRVIGGTEGIVGAAFSQANIAVNSGTAALRSASRPAAIGLTGSAARETVKQGIRTNAACSGATNMPFQHGPHFGLSAPEAQALRAHLADLIPLGRLGRPDAIAAAIAWLGAAESAHVVGHALRIDDALPA